MHNFQVDTTKTIVDQDESISTIQEYQYPTSKNYIFRKISFHAAWKFHSCIVISFRTILLEIILKNIHCIS